MLLLGEIAIFINGVTIGQENRGKRKGVPTIGDEVWIGVNTTIVGKVSIGDDVLIAPNAFVNCDIPSNSVVFIKHRDNATEGYIIITRFIITLCGTSTDSYLSQLLSF